MNENFELAVEEDADQPVFRDTAVDYGVNVSKADIEFDQRNQVEKILSGDALDNTKAGSLNTTWLEEERRKYSIQMASGLGFNDVADLLDAAEKIERYIITGQIPLTANE